MHWRLAEDSVVESEYRSRTTPGFSRGAVPKKAGLVMVLSRVDEIRVALVEKQPRAPCRRDVPSYEYHSNVRVFII